MGATNSTQRVYSQAFTGKQWKSHHDDGHLMLKHAGAFGQRRCAQKPAYAEPRGFALTAIYNVPPGMLNRYPPTVYSAQQAQEDIDACRRGRPLPHYKQVVRYNRISGSRDPRVYALIKYHGYSRRDFDDPRLLQLLPYSEKDAQIDISTYQTTGKPYYKVVKHTSTVIDPKRGSHRNWRHKGFDDKYKYSIHPTDQKVRRLGDRTGKKFDASKYPLVRQGSQWVRQVPCAQLPAMCKPGDKYFPYVNTANRTDGSGRTAKAAEVLEARKRKIRNRKAQVEHSKKMDRLSRKMKALNKADPKYQKLAQQRQALRGKRRPQNARPSAPPMPAGGFNNKGRPVQTDASAFFR